MLYFQEQCLFFSCLCGDATRRLYSFWNIVNYVQCDGACFVMFFKTVVRFGFCDLNMYQLWLETLCLINLDLDYSTYRRNRNLIIVLSMEVNSLHHLIVWRLAAIDWSISDSSSSTLWFLASTDCRSRALMLWNYKENSTCHKITLQYVVCMEKINLLTIANRILSDGVTIQMKPLQPYFHIVLPV